MLGLTLLLFLALSACSEGPGEVVQRALDARRAKDRAAFLACFTQRSQELLEGLEEVEAVTRKKLRYLDDPYRLLPKDGRYGEAREKGNVARMTVTGGREDIEVVLLREQGEWRIEALELEAFWEPMLKAAEVE